MLPRIFNYSAQASLTIVRRRAMAVAVIGSMLLAAPMATAADAPAKQRVYFGTYTGRGGKGIYVAEFDPASGQLSPASVAGELVNPSFLAMHPTQPLLYAVGEISDFGGKPSGGVTAFAIDPATGLLKQLNQQPSGGGGPCHLVVDARGKNVLVANYGGGSVAVLPLDAEGHLKPASAFIQHTGSSVDPARQEAPHAHSVNLDAANHHAIVADLGLDRLMVYKFDAGKGSLVANDPPSVALPAGGGPRHFAWHPSGKFAYTNNEMTSTVSALSYDADRGTFKVLETLSTLPEDFTEENSTAEVRVHPSGKYVYVSNRGHNSLAGYAIDSATGKLKPLGNTPTGGKVPRNFNFDPSGKFILAANQDSDNVVVLAVDSATGALKPTGSEIAVPMPVCVRFARTAGR